VSRPTGPLRIAVIGAGMSGILCGIRLREAGFDHVVIFEKADRIGGTWRENRYPGLSCDVPSHSYTYEFEPNPEWSHLFAFGPEIQAYFERVVAKYDLTPLLRLNSEIVRADYGADGWRLTLGDGSEAHFDAVIAATGFLHRPAWPDLPGLRDFGGPCFHSARWDESAVLDGRRVGIVGTGSTAAQITGALVDRVAHLSLFQRTAQWVLAYPNPPYTEAQRAEFRAHPEKMREVYDYWQNRFRTSFAEAVIGNEDEQRKIEQYCRLNLEQNVLDPVLRGKLTPDYRATCKRLIMSDSFYPAIQRPNASLVTEGIARVEANGVRTRDGALHELDVLVLATGFRAHDFMRPMRITGRDGLTLDDAWANSTPAYRCVALPGFPNFFMLCGPNSPIGNFSVIRISEIQLGYVTQLLRKLDSGDCRALEPTAEATTRFLADVREAMKKTVWVSGCRSWYLDEHGNPVAWPWSFERFVEDMRAPRFEEFRLSA
jgi:cation diffusion facilitator CzcD-associated flavoprotein CzcO